MVRYFTLASFLTISCQVSGIADNGTEVDSGPPDSAPLPSPSPSPSPDADGSVLSDAQLDAGVDLSSNPQHCGYTGHDCRGSDCRNGMCTPVRVAALCRPGDFDDAGPPSHLCGNEEVRGMASQGEDIVWLLGTDSIGGGAAYRARSDGTGSPVLVASAQVGNVSGPTGMAQRGNAVVWANRSSGTLFELPGPDAGMPRLIHMSRAPSWPEPAPGGYFFVGEQGAKLRYLAEGADASTILYDQGGSFGGIVDFASDATHLYFADCTVSTRCSIRRVPIAGGSAETLVENQRYVGCVALSATEVLWSLAPTPGVGSIAVAAVPKSGGTERHLSTRPGSTIPGPILVHGEDVISLDEDGPFRTDLSGSVAVPLAKPLSGTFTRACQQLTIENRFLYFGSVRGELWRVPL